MRGYQTGWLRALLIGVLTVGVLSALAGSAATARPVQAASRAAGPNTDPLRFWSVSKIVQGAGEVSVQSGAQLGGTLQQTAEVGRVAFNLPLEAPFWYFLPRDNAFGGVFSNKTGAQYSVLAQAPTPTPIGPGAPKGAVTHLDEYQAYEKDSSNASLRITLSDLLLQTVDDNDKLGAWECPPRVTCDPIRTIVRFHARAYAASAGGDFFDVGGIAYLEGHQHSWRPGAATSVDSRGPLWGEDDFKVDGDADDSGTGAAGKMFPTKALRLKVPLDAVRLGELFAVHVSLEAEAANDRGFESAAQAFVQDPQHGTPGLLSARGLGPLGKPRFKEPSVKLPPAARCPTGVRRHAGTVQLSSPAFAVEEAARTPMVLVTRTGGSRGRVSVRVSTSGGTARSGLDFTSTTTRVTFANGETSPRFVEIPIREDHAAEPPEKFTVSLSHPQCGRLGAQRNAAVTIFDDPQPPSTPPGGSQTFTIGGTVDGLRGSGLMLSNLGAAVPVSANGSFTFPGTAVSGQGYEVNVMTQPSNPDQVCTVDHGTGQVSSANVTDVAVHCQTSVIPSGLDSTFGGSGRVSTPVGGNGEGQAVVIQPSGQIVTAGWRAVGVVTTGIATDFALTRHNSDGTPDTNFGSGGVATTDLGGPGDEANDAALLPDGGIIAVGRTDAAGILNSDFGLVRYNPDGTPNTSFDTDGIVTTDFFGRGDQANAVAVQPDGKIVVAGFATHATGIDSDFALARYNPDGSLDTSFDGDGIVTTDLGTQSDDARALVIQPDGRIVVVGTAGEDIALARYTPDGKLDTSFGAGGFKITDLGFEDVATGVALTPDGKIVIAGHTIGATLNNDFLLARYDAAGTLDTTFGSRGTVTTDVGGGADFAENLTVDVQGRIILVGRATSPTILDMALVRYTPDGTPDTSFDSDGILTVDFHGRGDFGQDVAIDSSGKIVAAGYTANGGDTEFALTRINP